MTLVQQPLLIGAWIGLIHAFDADHISTLGSLAVRDRPRSALGYALRWACGHAVAIGLLGALALGVGMLRVASLSQYAEITVASLLVALGANAMASPWRRPSAAGVATTGLASGVTGGRRQAAGLVMGLLHGGAGSAAVLALLPLAGFDSGLAAAGFLLTFSFGVACGALAFAALFSGLMWRTHRAGAGLTAGFATLVGLVAIAVGVSMLLGSFDAGAG